MKSDHIVEDDKTNIVASWAKRVKMNFSYNIFKEFCFHHF